MSIKTSTYNFLMFFMVITALSCKKNIEIPPPDYQVGSNIVFKDNATALSAVLGIYSEMIATQNQFSSAQTTFYAGASADEIYSYTPGNIDEFVENQITDANHGSISSVFWVRAYKFIYSANLCIERLLSSDGISPSTKNMLIGECKFIRAFCFFYLVNLFGDVPLTLTADYRVNATMPRTSSSVIYQLIVDDLKDVQNLLNESYPSSGRTRPNKFTAAALLSRVYLYLKDYEKAEEFANIVISSNVYGLDSDLNKVFLKTSTESIWQLQPVDPTWNTWEGRELLPASANSQPTYIITDTLLNSFETGDKRKTNWIASRVYSGETIYYPNKYKVYGNNAPITEYYMVIRLAEIFLIRAEARANQSKLADGISDLNIIRSRAGLIDLVQTLTKEETLLAIEHERKIELMVEWGHRWLDLKRTNRVDAVLGGIKPATWQSTDQLWPIPINQINANPALSQNNGY